MGGACDTHGRQVRAELQELGADGIATLNLIRKKWDVTEVGRARGGGGGGGCRAAA
jgi:hypothetical protein